MILFTWVDLSVLFNGPFSRLTFLLLLLVLLFPLCHLGPQRLVRLGWKETQQQVRKKKATTIVTICREIFGKVTKCKNQNGILTAGSHAGRTEIFSFNTWNASRYPRAIMGWAGTVWESVNNNNNKNMSLRLHGYKNWPVCIIQPIQSPGLLC